MIVNEVIFVLLVPKLMLVRLLVTLFPFFRCMQVMTSAAEIRAKITHTPIIIKTKVESSSGFDAPLSISFIESQTLIEIIDFTFWICFEGEIEIYAGSVISRNNNFIMLFMVWLIKSMPRLIIAHFAFDFYFISSIFYPHVFQSAQV